jgi:putative FmdB family regulatory protein
VVAASAKDAAGSVSPSGGPAGARIAASGSAGAWPVVSGPADAAIAVAGATNAAEEGAAEVDAPEEGAAIHVGPSEAGGSASGRGAASGAAPELPSGPAQEGTDERSTGLDRFGGSVPSLSGPFGAESSATHRVSLIAAGILTVMPRYDFRCRACGDTFEVTRPMSAASAPANCPAGHDDTVKLLTTVAIGTAGRGSAGGPIGPVASGGGGCCGGGCGC